MKKYFAMLLLLVSLVGGRCSLFTDAIDGRVAKIYDGDTITVVEDGKKVKVRLAGIDAPELHQAFGGLSRAHLAALVFGKQVELEVEDTDRYGRKVARVLVGGEDVNLSQVEGGFAWVYRQYAHPDEYEAAEESARSARGLDCGRPRTRSLLGIIDIVEGNRSLTALTIKDLRRILDWSTELALS